MDANRWGHLYARYAEPRPRRMLALDGGGIRGLITLGILERMEELLANASGRGADFRLSDFFDYIAGTSTGAIIAAGLAMGKSVAELVRFYNDAGAQMFEKAALLKRFQCFYTADPLAERLRQVFGAETTLQSESLRSLLLIVTRNVTTDSAWPVSSNPEALYNDPARPDCNMRVPLWQLLRASTAAPIYFPPERLAWDPNDAAKSFVFVDGGMTPYNNPALLLFRMATHPAYRLGWQTGESNLLLVSAGTGTARSPGGPRCDGQNVMSNLAGIPGALMHGVQIEQDLLCRSIGRCTYGERIDAELGDLVAPASVPDTGRAFLYVRYNADLSPAGLVRLGCGDLNSRNIQRLDAVENIKDLRRVGRLAARQVDLEHFGSFVPAPL